jgi:putative endonuclease
MKENFWVYILASSHYGTLYIGMTGDLIKRIWEHKQKAVAGFTKEYNVDRLVYFERHETSEDVAKREKQIKEWKRDWKINLIEHENPNWEDLYECICN